MAGLLRKEVKFMNIKQKITSAAAIGVMMASVVAPASFAANTVTIKNNGAWSFNHVKVKNKASKVVVQANETVVETGVKAKASTGGNSSSFNTGGTNTTTTGKASNTVGISVTGGTNTNSGDDCGCPNPTTDVTIQGNGAFSHNGVHVVNSSSNTVSQTNGTYVGTMVMTSSSTGGNSSSFNTGGGNSIDTGNASNTVVVEVGGSSNSN